MLDSYAAPVVLIYTVRYRALARTRVLSTGVYSLAPQAYLTRALAIKMTTAVFVIVRLNLVRPTFFF